MNQTKTPEENAAVNFTASTLAQHARQLPCKDAAKLLKGFLLVSQDPAEFPELQALFQDLQGADERLQLIASRTTA